jgi:SLOG cluster2
MGDLLAPRVLNGLSVAISISESEDLARLGLAEAHLRLAVAEIVRAILVHGGRVIYGGHLAPAGYTAFLIGEVERFGSDRRFVSAMPWSEHLKLPFQEVWAARQRLASSGEVICLDAHGKPIEPEGWIGLDRAQALPPEMIAGSLTAMRKTVTGMSDARVILGGKRHGFAGAMPGILEETMLTVDAGKPIFLAGGFGGLAFDLADIVGGVPEASLAALRIGMAPASEALSFIRAKLRDSSAGILALDCLTESERVHVALSHRASEVASMIVTALGRLANAKNGGSRA